MINATRQDAIDTFTYFLEKRNIDFEKWMIQDFGIEGGETNDQLEEMVNDYVSECRTERCESKNTAGYTHEYYNNL